VLERRQVAHYASSGGVREDIAERDIILTYVLRIMSESVLPKLAFKGGTCLKKVYFGNIGRFSMDLDFTGLNTRPEELKEEINDLLNDKSWYDIDFTIEDENLTPESYLAEVRYAHAWNQGPIFKLQVSFREQPVFAPAELPLHSEVYFKYCEFQSLHVQCMKRDEVLSEKIRAAFQRVSSRDLYDLYLFAGLPYDRDTIKKLVVLKCWNVRDPFDPELFLDQVERGAYDWDDLRSLVRRERLPSEREMVAEVVDEYQYLENMDDELSKIIGDSRAHRENDLVNKVLADLRDEK